MSTKKKYYVVWKGFKTGIFNSWNTCKKQVDGFEGAQYKSFLNKKEAEIAFTKSFSDYKGKNTKRRILSSSEKAAFGVPIQKSLSVDAACSGNPGKLEYRGVLTDSKRQLFKQGPFLKGTNNIGEFLALVHALAFLKQKEMHNLPIYSDSVIAMNWIKQKKCKTKLVFTDENKELKDLIHRAESWLKNNHFNNPIIKWKTKVWGEIPADFGRK